jgi:branched-subunit amino acid transport protein
MNIWLVFWLGGLITFGMRLSFIYLFGRFHVPQTVHRALRFVPPAVLSAIIFPNVLMPNNVLDLSLGNHRWMAGLVAVLVAVWTKNTLLTILAGMVALLILQLVF